MRLAKVKLTSDLTDQMNGMTAGAGSRRSAGTYESDGLQTAWGNRDQLIPTNAQEDTDNWDGSGPWTLTIAVTANTSYILSVNLDGPEVSIAEDTATLDGTGSATYGSEFLFTCTGAGDITVTTDTADPKVMLEALPSGNVIGPDLFDQETTGAEQSSGNLTIDKIYRITARDDADFTADGAPDNNVDTVFIATGTSVTLDSGDKVEEITAPAKGIPAKDPWPALAGAEAITVQNDRDFSSGTIGNWVVNADGAGTLTYDATDIGGADNKQALLTSSGDTYLQARLSTVNFTFSVNTLYKFDIKVYAPAGNTLKDVKIGTYGLPVAWAGDRDITLVGDTWTRIPLYLFSNDSDVSGNIQVYFDGDPADGDLLYFDDVSIRPVQFSWVPPWGNKIEIDETEDALKITCATIASGAILYLRDSLDLSSNLIVGQRYLLEAEMKVGAGDDVIARVYDNAAYTSTGIIAESFTIYKLIFTAGHASSCFLGFASTGSGEVVYIRNYSIKSIPRLLALLEPSDYVNSATIPAMPRFEANGLLVEGEATNLLLYTRDLTNAIWAKTNITATKDQTGFDGNANQASKLLATAANGTAFQTIPTVQVSGAHTTPYWVKRITGSGPIYMSDDNGSNYTEIAVTATWTRFEIERTQTQPIIGFKIATDGDAIAVDFGQVEYTSFATSAIPATSSQVTRTSEAADGTYGFMWAISSALQATLANNGTLIIEWTPKFSAADGSGNICIATFEPAADGFIYYDFDNTDFEVTDSTNIVTVDKSIVKDTTYMLVMRWHKSDDKLIISVKDGSIWAHAAAGAFDDSIPHSGNKFYLHYGNEFPANHKNLYMFDRSLTDSEVEAEVWLDATGLLSTSFSSAKPAITFTASG